LQQHTPPPLGRQAAETYDGTRGGSGNGTGNGLRADPPAPGRRRRPLLLLTLLGVVAAVGVAVLHHPGGGATGAKAAAPTVTHTAPRPSTTQPATQAPTGDGLPESGPGTFVTARASGKVVGRGPKPLRYMVQVEKGIDISPDQAAQEIAGILAAPRGWTHDGTSSFQLVSSGRYDLKVRIATPKTTDDLCWAGIHQDTGGQYDCEVPGGVVVNLRRWVEGSPTFDGPIHDYRALIINHEMGHFLGHQHVTCPGPGKLAPVMMQQIKGLKGCVANAWPYDTHGHYVTGPPER
jgi:hypothetical protein